MLCCKVKVNQNVFEFNLDPLGSYTPETDQALMDADEARTRSIYLRRELKEAIDRVDKLQRGAHKSVNDGLTQKLSETITLKVSLCIL